MPLPEVWRAFHQERLQNATGKVCSSLIASVILRPLRWEGSVELKMSAAFNSIAHAVPLFLLAPLSLLERRL